MQVAVYDDRVEVTSPGMLYGGLTIEQIKEGGSKICNRCIAEVFSRMKIIESWGTGIKRMFSSCKEYGIKPPSLLKIWRLSFTQATSQEPACRHLTIAAINSLLLSARRLCAGNIPIDRCGETESTRYGKNLPGGISRFVAGKIDYRSRDFFRQPDFL